MPAYVLSMMTIHDPETYRKYTDRTPPVVKKCGIKQDGLNISKDLYDKGFYIPSGLSLTYQEQEYVASTLLEYVS